MLTDKRRASLENKAFRYVMKARELKKANAGRYSIYRAARLSTFVLGETIVREMIELEMRHAPKVRTRKKGKQDVYLVQQGRAVGLVVREVGP